MLGFWEVLCNAQMKWFVYGQTVTILAQSIIIKLRDESHPVLTSVEEQEGGTGRFFPNLQEIGQDHSIVFWKTEGLALSHIPRGVYVCCLQINSHI